MLFARHDSRKHFHFVRQLILTVRHENFTDFKQRHIFLLAIHIIHGVIDEVRHQRCS